MSDVLAERTYTPTSRPRGFTWGGFSTRAYVDLLRALVGSQMKVRYYHTIVGFGWVFINPIVQMVVYAYIFGSIFGNQRADFKLFILAGLLPWRAFADGLSAAVRSLTTNSTLLKKAPFPSELLPIAAVGTALINFLIVFVVYLAFLAIRGSLPYESLHWVLVALVIEVVFLVGVSLVVSSLNAFFRDIEQVVGFLIWIWFFLTPIVYPIGRLGPAEAKIVLALNPMAGVVTTIQQSLQIGGVPPADPLVAAGIIAAGSLALGWWLFRRFQYEFPKVV
jgi:lipopolysaccharide transport system permease protein